MKIIKKLIICHDKIIKNLRKKDFHQIVSGFHEVWKKI